MKTYLVSFLLMVFLFNYSTLLSKEQKVRTKTKSLSQKEYYDAVYASWIGQIIGNTYGLGYEFKFIDNPGPNKFPYGYSFTLNDLKKNNGAYSDDDTDIEYMYLLEMEKWGIEPNYFHLAEAWKAHVKERIWFANRMAVTLMHAGHYPPVTGMIGYNSEWFQIDPQLVNEIWAITSPGMIDYAVEKTEFAARITSDSFGLEPTLHYAAMFSAAFFEKDVNKLVDIGTSKLPKGSRFATIVEHVKDLYKTYPNDWQKAREIVKNNYYVVQDYNRHSWAAVDANMNGALGIMALLYGQGDFQKTLNYCCAFGMDADNQAATMCGLLGIVNGFKSIPSDLMYPVKDANWSKPFNDTYKMITREGLPDALISDMAKRTALQGEKIIMANGGRIVNKNGENYYEIAISKEFSAPFELNPIPNIVAETNKIVSYPLYTGGGKQNVSISVTGNLPNGIQVTHSEISGSPKQPGDYKFDIIATCGTEQKTISVNIKVFAANLAPTASKVLFNTNAKDQDIELIRDGKKRQNILQQEK